MVVRDPLGRPFRWFQAAMVSSDLADGIYRVSIPLVALHLTQSPIILSLVYVAVRLPWLLVTLPAGIIADRWPSKSVIQLFSVARIPLVLLLCWLVATDSITIWSLVILAFLIECAGNVVDVVAQSAVPTLVSSAQLPRANAILQTTQLILAQLIGPAVAGLLIALSDGGGLSITSVLYVVTVALLFYVRPRSSFGPQSESLAEPGERVSPSRHPFRELATGFSYFFKRQDLVLLATTAAANNFSYSMVFTMLPLWVIRPGPIGFNDFGYGLLLAVQALGSAAGGILVGRLMPPRLFFVARFGAPFLGICYFALAAPFAAVAAGTIFLYGAISVLWSVVTVSYRQSTIPREIFGRVNASFRWITWGMIPIGSLTAGFLANSIGVAWVFVIAGALPVIVGVLFPVKLDELDQSSRLMEPSGTK